LLSSDHSGMEREVYGYGTNCKSSQKSWRGLHHLPQGAITPPGPVSSLQCDYGPFSDLFRPGTALHHGRVGGSQAVFPVLCGTCQRSGRELRWANLSDPGMLHCKMIAWCICFPLQHQGCGTFEWPDEREDVLLVGRRMKLSGLSPTLFGQSKLNSFPVLEH